MSKIKPPLQQGPQHAPARKSVSDVKIKIIGLLVFLGVAVGGFFLNVGKTSGTGDVFGFDLSSLFGEQNKEAKRKAIVDSDMSDALKARKLHQLALEE